VARFRVLVTEPVHPAGIEYLEERDVEVVAAPAATQETLLDLVDDVDGILLRARGRVNADVMDHAPRLKVVGRHGVGVDNIDIPEATRRGIRVVNTPQAPMEPVAEHTFALILGLVRRVLDADRAAREGNWSFREQFRGPELKGKTLGIVGFGQIGRRIGEIGALGFGMSILYHDRVRNEEAERRLGASPVPLDDLLARADVVSLNVPLNEETHHLIGEPQLRRMKETAFLINTSRGPVVDEPALVRALREHWIAGAGIDVYETEPAPPENPLFALGNVVVAPHMAGHAQESLIAMSMVAADILRVLEGEEPEFPVNTLK